MEVHTELVERIDDLKPHEKKNVVSALQELLATCYDAKAGYEEAARDANDAELSQLLKACAVEHEDAGNALSKLLLEMGIEPRVEHSFGAELHRRLIALRSTVSQGQAASILAECERGEHIAISRYERALLLRMPMPVADMLLDFTTACRERRAAFDRMRRPW